MKMNHVAACLIPVSPGIDGAIQLFPAGEFTLPHGAMMGNGPWRIDEAAANALIAKVAARNNPLVVDYEHQSLLSRDNGQPAPAAGWIAANSLEWRKDGLYALNPTWTERAKAMLAAGEYRFLSPVFTYDPELGVPTDLLNVALTNNPAIDGMQPVMLAAARFNVTQESPMDDLLEVLRECLNLPIAATAADISAELTKIIGLISSAPMGAAKTGDKHPGLRAVIEAQQAEVAALKASNPNPAQFAPIAALTALQNELAVLKARDLERDIADLIDPALSDGRLLVAQEQWARDLGKSNLGALKAYLDTAHPIAALKGTQTQGKAPEGDAKLLTEEQQAVCKALGISHDQYRKSLEA